MADFGAKPRIGRRFCTLAIIALLSGCDAAAPSGQVLAKIGRDEITSAQLSVAMGGRADDAINRPAEAAALRGLIDQTLLVRDAKKRRLGQQPEVARELDAADRNVVAAAYVRSVIGASTLPQPTAAEISGYYHTHPGMFESRRVLIVTEVGVSGLLGETATRKAISAEADPDRICAILVAQGVNVTPTIRILSPEQLVGPTSVLRAAKAGDHYNYTTNGILVFGRIDEVRETPLSLAQAHDAIASALEDKVAQQRIQSLLASLRRTDPVAVGALGKAILLTATVGRS